LKDKEKKMKRLMVTLTVLLIASSFLIGSRVSAAIDPLLTCQSTKLSAVGTSCKAHLNCVSKWVKDPYADVDELYACFDTAWYKFLSSWDKAEAAATKKGVNCSGTVSEDEVDNLIIDGAYIINMD
jgi:hypothetical protein